MATAKDTSTLKYHLYPVAPQFYVDHLVSTLRRAEDVGFRCNIETQRHKFDSVDDLSLHSGLLQDDLEVDFSLTESHIFKDITFKIKGLRASITVWRNHNDAKVEALFVELKALIYRSVSLRRLALIVCVGLVLAYALHSGQDNLAWWKLAWFGGGAFWLTLVLARWVFPTFTKHRPEVAKERLVSFIISLAAGLAVLAIDRWY